MSDALENSLTIGWTVRMDGQQYGDVMAVPTPNLKSATVRLLEQTVGGSGKDDADTVAEIMAHKLAITIREIHGVSERIDPDEVMRLTRKMRPRRPWWKRWFRP